MDGLPTYRDNARAEFAWHEVSGAIGDAVTVVPIVVAVAILTELSLSIMLLWFGIFQVVWGLHYGAPISVEPMKALAALVIGGTVSTGELVVAGLLLAGILLLVGATHTLDRIEQYIGKAVVRGIQLGVALVLLETGVDLVVVDLGIAALAGAGAVVTVAAGYRASSAFVVFLVGLAVALARGGVPVPALPPVDAVFMLPAADLTLGAFKASLAQLAMTIGNAALATAVLLGDYFDRDVSADALSSSMGAMNAVAVPLGGFPMCHGSGGVAGKYAFGARTPGANIVLGVGYVLVALLAVGLVSAYPTAVLGVILTLISLQLGYTGLSKTDDYLLVVSVGILGLVVNLGVALVAGVLAHQARARLR